MTLSSVTMAFAVIAAATLFAVTAVMTPLALGNFLMWLLG